MNTDTRNRENLKAAQTLWRELGIYSPPLRIDGLWGPGSFAALQQWIAAGRPGKMQDVATPPTQTTFEETTRLTPQVLNPRVEIVPRAIILHHTAGNFAGSVDWTSRTHRPDGARLYASYHVIIARDGRRCRMVEDTVRAYHAGVSAWSGRTGLNGWSLGLAWERDTNTEPLQEAAILSALEWIIPRMKRWGISVNDVTDHRTVATPAGRKNDIAPAELERFLARLREALK